MRWLHWLHFALCVSLVALVLPLGAAVVAQQATSTSATKITDPRLDPAGTLQDVRALSEVTEPIAGPLAATADVDSNIPVYLSSGVQIEQLYARYSFVVPSMPIQSWMVGFTFWDDGNGNYYDLAVIRESGSLIWGLGITTGYQYRVDKYGEVDNPESFDTTPGSVNTVSLVFYDKFVLLAANDTKILAQVDLEVSGSGNVRAKIGWGMHPAVPAPAQQMSIFDFSVWQLPSDGAMPAGVAGQPGPTPSAAPVQTPGVFVSSRDQATPSTTGGNGVQPTSSPAPTASANQIALLTEIFQKERSDALAGSPIWSERNHGLGQVSENKFNIDSASVSVEDAYVIATFVNPDNMLTTSDYGIGIRDNNDNREFRFIVDTNGGWSVALGAALPFAVGMTPVDATPGAEIALEVIARGATGILAVNGLVVAQVDLSANLNEGGVYIATGMLADTRVAGRRVVYSRFDVYPLAS